MKKRRRQIAHGKFVYRYQSSEQATGRKGKIAWEPAVSEIRNMVVKTMRAERLDSKKNTGGQLKEFIADAWEELPSYRKKS